MKRAVVICGLGFGDCGKGATVDHLCHQLSADLVVRYCGGSQCSHNVVLPNGQRHNFSQFGSGTLAGVTTYIGPQVIIYPEALKNEADHLFSLGIDKPFSMLKVHPLCLVTTKYHRAANRIREVSRTTSRHGSCGHGIGEARRYWLNYGKDAIFLKDLTHIHVLRSKLELMRQRFLMDLQPLLDTTTVPDEESVFDLLVHEVADNLCSSAAFLTVGEAMPSYSTAIFEGAQGVLLDEYNGFHPNTTWSTVTMRYAQEMLAISKANAVVNMGVTRAYLTRHGNGPLPTEDKALTEIVNDKGNPWNAWQGNFRAGWLDVSLLKYASEVVGGKLDCIAVNCIDHLEKTSPKMAICNYGDYKYNSHRYRLSHSELESKLLENRTKPPLNDVTAEDVIREIEKIAPVAIRSYGPTFKDRKVADSAKWLGKS